MSLESVLDSISYTNSRNVSFFPIFLIITEAKFKSYNISINSLLSAGTAT